jgi:hypothetical protein
MKRTTICACLLAALAAGTAWGQRPDSASVTQRSRSENRIAVGELQPTPEMWFYEQYQQQDDDPAAGVRIKAQFRAAQRQNRLAAMRWFGFSNSRPQANTDMLSGDYSPRWTSMSGAYPNRWGGQRTPLVVIQPKDSSTR